MKRIHTISYDNYDNRERCVRLAEYMISNRSTVRATASYFGISKSTVHKDLVERLHEIDPGLHQEVSEILGQNKAERHLRGGLATKIKYRMLRDIEKTE